MITNQFRDFEEDNFPTVDSNECFVSLEEKDLCYIDEETSRSLELLCNNVDSANKKHSLFGYLNTYTNTTSGARLLREGIKSPPYHLATIEHRLDCIEYLVNRVDTLSAIANPIRHFGYNIDLDNVVPALVALYKTRCDTLQMAEKRLDAITTVGSLVSQVPILIGALELASQHTLNLYKNVLEDPSYRDILNDIYNVIEPEMRGGKGKRAKIFKIRQGVESLFDIARTTYNAAIDDVEQYVRELTRLDGLAWKLNSSGSRGFYLSISSDCVPKTVTLPDKYIQVVRTRSQITCTTKDLMQSNVRANVSYENSMKLANELLTSTLATIIDNLGALNKLVDVVAMLDMITSLAKLVLSSNGTLVRPKFTATDTIINNGRHPVLEAVLSANNIQVVPNNVLFSVVNNNFMLVTGPNMGGKSIFLKQVGLIQIMAQLGCYVPAESAHLRLVNRIVARSGTGDDFQSSCSSFMWEMRGISTALQDKTIPNPNVLYIIDEVGRGTTIDDGASFSFAIAEELASRKDCFTVFATHFEQVFVLTELYRNVRPYHISPLEHNSGSSNGIRINHKLVPGIASTDHYGIKLAEACGFPEEILQVARKDLSIL